MGGLAKLKLMDTQCFRIRQRVRDLTIELRNVLRTENPAELFTNTSPSLPELMNNCVISGACTGTFPPRQHSCAVLKVPTKHGSVKVALMLEHFGVEGSLSSECFQLYHRQRLNA